MEDKHFEALMYKMDTDGDGTVSYSEFLRYFGKGGDTDRQLISKVSDIPVPAAISMIRNKIEQKLPGGPSGLRRAFQLFDDDGSGAISHAEFSVGLRKHWCVQPPAAQNCQLLKVVINLYVLSCACSNLEFDANLLSKIIEKFDDDRTGQIDFRKFAQLVMGSKQSDKTSFGGSSREPTEISDDNGTSDQMIRRKVREQWKSLGLACKWNDRQV
eukprot:SAG31_NODE_9884_length_1216_cov_1.514772_1_plen_213_part_01